MNIRIPNALQATPASNRDLYPRWRRATRLKLLIGTLALAALGLLLWWLLSGPPNKARPIPPPPVRTAFAEQRDVAGLEHSIGTAVAISTVQVTSLVTGQMLATGFIEGQIVTTGQLLFQIDPKPFAAALAQARAALARDQANSISADHDKVRFTTLAAQGAASAQQRDQAIAAADADEATVQSDKAAIQTAELNLGYTTIRSPITGKTGPLLIQPGNLITANNTASPLVAITQLQPIKVSMFLPQSDLPLIQHQIAAKRLIMSVKAGTGSPITAPVNFVGNQVDPKTGTVELRSTFDNIDYRLVPGQLVDAAVTLNDYRNATVVPREAVNIGPESRYVFVVGARNVAVMRQVNVLYDDGANDAVTGDIRPGDRIIVEGQLRVIPDRPVQIVSALPRTAAGRLDQSKATSGR